jgi:hypothetical protein
LIFVIPNAKTSLKMKEMHKSIEQLLPVAMILSPGARIAPGGRMKQLFGAVVWN